MVIDVKAGGVGLVTDRTPVALGYPEEFNLIQGEAVFTTEVAAPSNLGSLFAILLAVFPQDLLVVLRVFVPPSLGAPNVLITIC